jgi:CRP-like cAMP-binding protein
MGYDPETRKILRGIAGFEQLDTKRLEALAASASLLSVAENTLVYQEDDASSDVFLIISGIITIRSRLPAGHDRESELMVLRSGTFFGVLSFLDGARRNLGAFARERSLLLRFDGPRLKAACEADATLGRAVYSLLGTTAARLARDVSMELRNLIAERE